MPRPNVPTTRSFNCRWMARSRTAIVGKLLLRCVHLLAAVSGAERPDLGAGERRIGMAWAPAMASTDPRPGRSPTIEDHDRPASVLLSRYGAKSPILWLSNAAYTVSLLCSDATTRLT